MRQGHADVDLLRSESTLQLAQQLPVAAAVATPMGLMSAAQLHQEHFTVLEVWQALCMHPLQMHAMAEVVATNLQTASSANPEKSEAWASCAVARLASGKEAGGACTFSSRTIAPSGLFCAFRFSTPLSAPSVMALWFWLRCLCYYTTQLTALAKAGSTTVCQSSAPSCVAALLAL